MVKRRITIPSRLENIKPAVDEILLSLKDKKVDDAVMFDIRLSIEEAVINAMKHGNHFREKLTVDIDYMQRDNKITVAVEDRGKGFDYKRIPNPTHEKNLLRTQGRGVFLIKHLMDRVGYNKKGNRVIMTKLLRKG